MGHGLYSKDVHRNVTENRLRSGTDFTYSRDMLSRPAHERKVNELLDPKRENQKGDNAGTIIRESLDFPEHPNTTPIVIVLDVTGSMAQVPREIVAELPKLIDGLIKAGVPDPQVLICANGDAYSDSVPVQIGQFESDNRIDEQIDKLILEGGGGGGNHESYDLIAWFLAYKTHLDAVELRDQKGFCFFLADERLYSEVKREQVLKHFGEQIDNVDTKDVFADLRMKFETFMLYPHAAEGSYRRSGEHCKEQQPEGSGVYGWREVLDPEQVIDMRSPVELIEQVANIVASRVGEKAEI